MSLFFITWLNTSQTDLICIERDRKRERQSSTSPSLYLFLYISSIQKQREESLKKIQWNISSGFLWVVDNGWLLFSYLNFSIPSKCPSMSTRYLYDTTKLTPPPFSFWKSHLVQVWAWRKPSSRTGCMAPAKVSALLSPITLASFPDSWSSTPTPKQSF